MPEHLATADAGPRDLVTRSLHVRAVRDEAREADFVCSTDAVDSYGEIVEQNWNLSRYESNPVVLFAHQSRELPIGQARSVRVEGGQLVATLWFSDAHQMARDVWKCVQEKTLRAVSVGFLPSDLRVEMRDGVEIIVLSNNELFEISVTPIPANAECVARLRARARATTSASPARDDSGDNDMSEPNDQKIKAAEDALGRAEKALSDERAKTAALDERVKATEKALTEERAAKAALAAQIVERDVDALVGKKIQPNEKPSLVKLAALSPELYGEQLTAIKSRPDMPTAKSVDGGEGVMGKDPAALEMRSLDADDNGQALDAAIRRNAAKGS